MMKRILSFFIFILMATAILLPSCQKPKTPANVYDMQCESQENPLGIDRSQPLFSWKMDDSRRGACQTAYQVLVSDNLKLLKKDEGNIWNSGKVESGSSTFIKYKGAQLEPKKTYYWKIKVWDKDGQESDWSDPVYWETGMLKSPWEAHWISRSADEPCRSAYMRKEISVAKKTIEKARVYVTGLGNYVFYINGERVGNDLLTPGWTFFPKRLEYQVYDVTGLVKKGSNALGTVLGNMWWSGGLGWKGGTKYSEGPLKFLMQLEVTFTDGSKETFGTDESWKWKNSPIVSDHIYHGETYDANLEMPGWNTPGFAEEGWAAVEPASYEGILTGPYAPALREQMGIDPIALNEPAAGEYVYDMGQNMVGWVKFKMKAEKGDTIKLRFAELLHDDGTVAQENLRSAKATDKIISNGSEITWEPKFTYHGFRYVQVSGLKSKPQLTDLVGKVIHTSSPIVGSFESSNKLLNNIYKNILWGQRGNFFAAPTDCPQRDERLGWMGDSQIFAPTANFNMNLGRYWAKWMFDITDGQDKEGWVYDVNPPIVVKGPSKPGWGDAVVVIPWLSYQYFGDTRIIEDNYEGMKAWVEYMNSKSENYIYVWRDKPNGDWFGYGDWIAVEKSPSKPIGTAYFYYSAKLLSQMAQAIGKTDDAAKYAELSGKIAEAYQKEYWDKKARNYEGATQTANILPLAFGITPDSLKEQVAKNLADDVLKHNVHPTTGFLGTGYILPMLSKYNYHNLAYEMINKTDYPSWGYMVEKGATTMWELWNSDSERPEGMNSRNHFALGGIGEWVWNTLVGINICPEFPGFKRFVVKPEPIDGLGWVKGEYETNYGLIKVDWKAENGNFAMELTVPANSEAVIVPPALKEGAVLKEGGKEVKGGNIEGIKITEDGKILAAAGSYSFTLD